MYIVFQSKNTSRDFSIVLLNKHLPELRSFVKMVYVFTRVTGKKGYASHRVHNVAFFVGYSSR